ncbi:unnamed protein product [Closterium sp. NIES-53]
MTPSSYKPQEPRFSDVEQCHTVPNHEGSRNYPPQGPTPREMLHYTKQNVIKSWVRGTLCNPRLGELMQISLLKYDIDRSEALGGPRGPAKSAKLAVAERDRKGKAKEGEDEAENAAQNEEEEGEEEEEDVEEVFHTDKPVH